MHTKDRIPFIRPLIDEIRNRFACVDEDSLSGSRIYLENAGGSLTLKAVIELVARHTAFPDNAGRRNQTSREIDRVIEQGKVDLKTFLGSQCGIVALGESTTVNAFKILSSLIRNVPGGNVVTTDLDHPAVRDATKVLADQFQKEWRSASLSQDKGTVDVDSLLSLVDQQTIVLAMIHSSNIFGTKNDVKSLIREARKLKPELFVLVDGAQYGPHSLIDVKEMECDAYLVSSYKTFSKAGASAMYLSERTAKLPHDQLLGKPQTDWELGTREQAGYAAWSAVMDYLCWLGGHFTEKKEKRELIRAAMQAIAWHENALAEQMLHGRTGDIPGLLEFGKIVVAGEVEDLSIKDPIFLFSVEGIRSAEVVDLLEEAGVRVHNRQSDAYSQHTLSALGMSEGIRVSACHYNTEDEIDTFLKALQRIAR